MIVCENIFRIFDNFSEIQLEYMFALRMNTVFQFHLDE